MKNKQVWIHFQCYASHWSIGSICDG